MKAAPAMPMPVDLPARAPRVAREGAVVLDEPVSDVSERFREQWQALAGRAAEANCFAEPWFVAAGLRQLADTGVRLLQVWSNGDLLGVLPACVASYGRMKVRHVENWQHHHDFLGTPLIRAGGETDFWLALLRHLDDADWAPAFFHIAGLVEGGPVHRGLEEAARLLGRACPVVHRSVRAALESDLSPRAYYESRVRKKKRKELQRLSSRLAELGEVTTRTLAPGEDPAPWVAAFLTLERSGWKGRAGSALACDPATRAFLAEAVAGAADAGRLDFLRMDLDGRPIAMLVNFITPPGSFSFKIAFDEAYARFSPGVLIQRENLRILDRRDVAWMDSCASENHPMIDSLWSERRAIVRVTVRLGGLRRGLVYYLCRGLEIGSAARWAALARLRRFAKEAA